MVRLFFVIELLPILGRFIVKVLRGFKRNQGLLLSGAIAYYTLLSLIPMLALSLVVLSHFIDETQLMLTIGTYLTMVFPRYGPTLAEQVRTFLEYRHVIGIVGVLFMLFFSSIAFTAFENAMSVIFFHRVKISRRHFLISAIIPYLYISLLSVGIFFVTVIVGILKSLETEKVIFLNWYLSLEGVSGFVLSASGIAGEVLLLTSLYLVMPVGRVTFRHALLGGATATLLWEIIRRLLIWYYTKLSFVNIIYGPLATTVVALISVEAAAIILLIGAQVIAEFERSSADKGDAEDHGFQT